MLESVLVKKLKEHIKKQYKATCHKYHGSPGGETGHADLYGTLPGGKAYYIEVKSPTATQDKKSQIRMNYQRAWMVKEKKCGALIGFAQSIKDVDEILNGAVILWIIKK